MTWHLSAEILDRYRDGRLDDVASFSTEAHLATCPVCQEAVRAQVAGDRFESVWADIVERIDEPVPSPVERVLRRLGVSEHVARLIAGVPALTVPWITGIALVLGFAVVTAHLRPVGTVFFLSVAAVLPLAGIATAYGPGLDPMHEVGIAAPVHGTRLLLIRAVTVLAASTGASALAALALPGLSWTTVAWIMPSLALVLLALAAGTFAPPAPSAAIVGVAWLVLTGGAHLLHRDGAFAFGATAQLIAAAVAIVSAGVLLVRRERLERISAGRAP